MPAVLARPRIEAVRKRRAHAKSRKGCGNCKLRRIKCDEAQPGCRKCKLYGVACDYSGSESSLNLEHQGSRSSLSQNSRKPHHRACDYSGSESSLNLDAQGSFQVDFTHLVTVQSYSLDDTDVEECEPIQDKDISSWIPPLDSVSISRSLTTIVDDSLRYSVADIGVIHPHWRFSSDHLGILMRFRERTSVTIGNPHMAPIFRDPICQLACQHAFLMHMLLSITLMHDAHLANAWAMTPTKSSQDALRHWNIASKLFNEVLSQPIPPAYRDAIWATGVFLGAASFWSVGSTNPYEVWPLKPSEPDDLAWLKIGEGKKHLWRLAQPTRSDSIFCPLVKDNSCLSVPEWSAVDPRPHIAPRIMKIFGFSNASNENSNVYYRPVLTLSMCPNVKLTDENALKFLYIMAVITPEFFELLEVRDMKAMFIMGWWYILLTTGDLWWMSRRARIEGQAIRIWLRQRGGNELADLLDEIEQQSGSEEAAATWFFERRQA